MARQRKLTKEQIEMLEKLYHEIGYALFERSPLLFTRLKKLSKINSFV